ncbi:MAG: potassium transporter [Bacteroidetes bacterium]|nr:potassium transporter [Bacteroidota bacterium]
MDSWKLRIVATAGVVVVTLVLYSLLYQWGMRVYEGQTVSFIQALQVVVESITTAGFGGYAPWSSTAMNGLVLLMNLTGVLFVFLAIPLFGIPLLQDALKHRLPTAAEVSDHIIISPYTRRTSALIEELSSRGHDYLILEFDEDRAEALYAEQHPVIYGNPESVNALERCCLSDAAAVVIDVQDHLTTSVVLSIREISDTVQVVSVNKDTSFARYHRLAGADQILFPRQLIGENLANELPFMFSVVGDRGIKISEDMEIAELQVAPEGPLCHRTVAELGLRERYGVQIIGAWFEGTFTSPISPQEEIDSDTRLLISGAPSDVQGFQQEAHVTVKPLRERHVVIAGYGRAGRAAAQVLATAGVRVTTIDIEDKPEVDIVGDARDPEVYQQANIAGASALIIDLDDDSSILFATLVVHSSNPDLYIATRANQEANMRKIYRAGADYVQSLAAVSGRMLASTVLERQEVLAVSKKIVLVQLEVGRLSGHTLAAADVRAETGCTVLAAVRDGTVLTSLGPQQFVFQDDDEIILAGTDENVRQFEEQFLL